MGMPTRLWGCGNNEDGQLGNGAAVDLAEPRRVMMFDPAVSDVHQVSRGGPVLKVSCGNQHTHLLCFPGDFYRSTIDFSGYLPRGMGYCGHGRLGSLPGGDAESMMR